MVKASQNGCNLEFFNNPNSLPDLKTLRARNPLSKHLEKDDMGMQETSEYNQLKVLISRGYLRAKRDTTLTYMRIGVNILTGLMLGVLYIQAGQDGAKVLDNYNLLFSILMHHMMSTMMLTILTCKYFLLVLQIYAHSTRKKNSSFKNATKIIIVHLCIF